MTVKHVSAPTTPGLQAAGGARKAGHAPQTPPAQTGVNPAHSPPLQDGSELAAAQAMLAKAAGIDTAAAQAGPDAPPHAPERTGTIDYYAIISKTVAGLVLNNVETRGEVYDRAREVVNKRLIDSDGQMSSRMVAIEQIAFDRAIKKIEAEQRALDSTRPTPPPRPRTQDLRGTPSPGLAPLENTSAEAAPAKPSAPQAAAPNGAPAITVARRPVAMPEVKHLSGGTLRLFAIVALIVAGVGGYWLAAGKPNLMGLRAPVRTVSAPPAAPSSEADREHLSVPVDIAARDQPASTTAVAPPAPSQPASAPPVTVQPGADDPDAVAFVQRETDLASFLSLCRPAMTPLGEQPCGNLEPRPFGGAPAASRNAPEWVAMYSDLSDTIPAKRIAKPGFSASTPSPQPPQSSNADQTSSAVPAGDTSARTTNSAAREKFERGIALAKADNLDGAVASFSGAVKLDPKFSDAYLQRGQAMFKNGNPEHAIADFTLALQADPRNAPAHKARGMAMLYKGDDDSAIADLTKAIQYAEIDANSIPPLEIFYARRSRATLYDRKQLYDRELTDLSAMIDSFWKNPGLATALKATHRDQGANALVASIYRLRAGVHQKRNSIDSAVGDLSFAIQIDPQRSLQYMIERGRILEMAGKREQAIADYKQALELSPANSDVKSALARLRGKS